MMGIRGLSSIEVEARRAQGKGNGFHPETSRTYWEILKDNAFTFINSVLFIIGLVLIMLGRTDDAIVTAGLVLMNVVVGVFQEGRAKRKLDQIALLTRPTATVIRDGESSTIDPSELVTGDILVVQPGDQIVADGTVVGTGRMSVDESLLTGESDLIPKRAGDPVYSGSFCVSGSAAYEAEQLGAESVANKITLGARAFRVVKTPLQRDVDYVIRVLVLLATNLGVLLAISFTLDAMPLVHQVQVAAVIAAMVPQGLFFMTTVTYAMGAVRMAGRGALVQQANAIESMSNVDVLCMDKTGTLTTNRITLHEVKPIGIPEADLKQKLGDFVASASSNTKTSEAILTAFGGRPTPASAEVPFSSAHKWSALAFENDGLEGVYVLGAPEVMQNHINGHVQLKPQIEQWAAQGLRVLLFAYRPEAALLNPIADKPPELPGELLPLGLVSFSDELRPGVQQTLRGFTDAGIQLKIISGDSPTTVEALARQSGLDNDLRVISGLDLANAPDEAMSQAADEGTVFGRITPEQKEDLVRTMRSRGHYVAMIGDGVNDVLSLKQAHIGIAMNSGSQATRSVADIVLLNDSFDILPRTFNEGQRILNGMQDIVRLFLSRTFYVVLLVIATAIIGIDFPFTPKHNSLVALLTVGIPTIALAMWSRPGQPTRGLIHAVGHFVGPAAFSVTAFGLGVYLTYLLTFDIPTAQSALTTAVTLCGILLIVFVEPPTKHWAGGDELSGDWRPTILAGVMLAAFAALLGWPEGRGFFDIVLLRPLDYVLIGAAVAIWGFVLRTIWRTRLLDRLLDPRHR